MANLLFKKGLHAALPTTHKEGTVYITTDERAMYLDTSDSTRIRIQGTVLYYDTLAQFTNNTKPPYSTDVIYFIANENALVRWNGNAWVQLNVTKGTYDAKIKEIVDFANATAEDLSTLTGRVDTAEADIDALEVEVAKKADSTTVAGINTRLTTAEGTITTHTNTIKTLATKTEVNDVASDLSDLDLRVTANENNKVDKVNGKGLSTNDFTNAFKDKLTGIEDAATETYVDGTLSTTAGDKHAISNKAATIKFNELDESLGNLDTKINGVSTNLTNNYVTNTTYNGKVAEIEGDISKIEEALGLGDNTGTNTVSKRLDDLETLTGQHTQTLNGHASDIGELQTTTGDHENRLQAVESKAATNESNISKNAKAITDLGTNVANTYVTKTTYEGKVAELAGNIQTNASDIAELDSNKADKTTVATLETTLKAQIESEIKAVNAMTYKGGVGTAAALSALTGVKIGDTYVVTAAFGNYQPGDLLIANGTETGDDGDATITAGLNWQHVATGYTETHESRISADNNSIKLSSYVGADLGSVKIASSTENLVISTADNTITIGMEWGTF